MDDITTALETVRTAVEWSYQRRVRATLPALSTIEAELTRLRKALEEANDLWFVKVAGERDKAEAERDEAVAALREIEAQAKVAFRGKVSALTLLDIISRARLSE